MKLVSAEYFTQYRIKHDIQYSFIIRSLTKHPVFTKQYSSANP